LTVISLLQCFSRACFCFATLFFFFTYTAPTEIYTLSLHDALPIYAIDQPLMAAAWVGLAQAGDIAEQQLEHRSRRGGGGLRPRSDRKSTRLNSSHVAISYAVFCLKKKKTSSTNSQSRQYS